MKRLKRKEKIKKHRYKDMLLLKRKEPLLQSRLFPTSITPRIGTAIHPTIFTYNRLQALT
jgi:hypothetical protein